MNEDPDHTERQKPVAPKIAAAPAKSESWWQPAAVLSTLALVVAAGLALLHASQSDRIIANQRAFDMRQIQDLLQHTVYNNDVFSDLVFIDAATPGVELLGATLSRSSSKPYILRARLDGEPAAAIMHVTTQSGYAGPIKLLVAINADGSLAGVRVSTHRETPGLGDKIELDKSPWILQFDDRSLQAPLETDWKVRKDGGQFDQITGATVTPRAIVAAVRDALLFYSQHRETIFTTPNQALLAASHRNSINTRPGMVANHLSDSL